MRVIHHGVRSYQFLQEQGFSNSTQPKQRDMIYRAIHQAVKLMIEGSQFLTMFGEKRLPIKKV